MAYQKTAKDKAWDRERQKLRGEANYWQLAYGRKEREYQEAKNEIAMLQKENEKLRAVITSLTEEEASPEEIMKKLNKNAELHDMMKFLFGGYRSYMLNGTTMMDI